MNDRELADEAQKQAKDHLKLALKDTSPFKDHVQVAANLFYCAEYLRK